MASFDDIVVLFIALAVGDAVSHEEAVAIARQYPNHTPCAIQKAMHEVGKARGPITLPMSKLMQVLWDVFGPSECLNTHFDFIPSDLFEFFVGDELRSRPEQFDDADLERVTLVGHSESIRTALCRARLYRAKREAQQLLSNPTELGDDLERVKAEITSYKFNTTLNDLLDQIGRDFGKGSGFDQAAMMKHLRSFFEKLHAEVATTLHSKKLELKDGTDLTKCQQVIDYMERKEVLTKKAQALGRALYGILSEEGVHALESTREYVRLCRNMIAEYGLILFYELDRRLSE